MSIRKKILSNGFTVPECLKGQPGIIVCFGVLAVIVYLSYNYFEKYFLALKQSLVRVRTVDI